MPISSLDNWSTQTPMAQRLYCFLRDNLPVKTRCLHEKLRKKDNL